ncbi:MAG: Rrf2 family transcriptional regulator, partial [Clostridiales bacterium]
MKISTKGRYGIKAVMDLALNKKDGVIPLKHISERQNISDNYLEQLLAVLRKNGIVKSV